MIVIAAGQAVFTEDGAVFRGRTPDLSDEAINRYYCGAVGWPARRDDRRGEPSRPVPTPPRPARAVPQPGCALVTSLAFATPRIGGACSIPSLDLVVLAHPEGVGRETATYVIPIGGRDEWSAAARRLV